MCICKLMNEIRSSKKLVDNHEFEALTAAVTAVTIAVTSLTARMYNIEQQHLTTTPPNVVVNLTEQVLVNNLVNSLPRPDARPLPAPLSYTPDEVSKMTDAELIYQFARITGCTRLSEKNKNPTNLIYWVDAIRARCIKQHTKGGGKGLYAEMPLPKTSDAKLHQNIKTNDENNKAFGLLRKAYKQNDQQTINIVQQKRGKELAKVGVVTNPYKYKIVLV